jgi:putative transposase
LGCIHESCGDNISDKSKYFCEKHIKKRLKYSCKINLQGLRKEVMIPDKQLSDDYDWLKDVPYDTRQLAIKDFCSAYKAIMTNRKRGNINNFYMRFKSKKNPTQIFHINKNALKPNLQIFSKRKIGRLRTRRKMTKWIKANVKSIDHDCKIIRYDPNRYYLLLTFTQKKRYQKPKLNTVSLDPGVRTFQTFYSPDGVCGKMGDNFTNKTQIIEKRIDALKSARSKVTHRTRYNLNGRISLLRTKIKNMVNDLHWKTCHFLCDTFETIIIPEFKTKDMTNRERRNIHKGSVKRLTNLSHYSFLCKLKHKSKIYRRNLLIVNESYTSQTCGKCGKCKTDLKSSKIYKCDKCGMKMDRDINGARNILLRTLTCL